ncbi:MAG: hypothetical protein HGA45_06675 [Chloroflexales bacterium]|nr:hypothetical protein [Chloroflexales bacterium]
MNATKLLKETPIRGEDIPRWLTFASFWGAISYLLSCVSLLVGNRRDQVRLNLETIGLGFLLHTAGFITGGSLAVAAGSIASGKSTTAISQEEISGGQLERSVVRQGLGGALGSVVPFMLALGSIEIARKITGKPAFGEARATNWPLAVGTMVGASGIVSLAVSQITAWVAKDAKS